MITLKVDKNELLFLLQSIDLKLVKYAEKKVSDYPEGKVKKILELKKLRDKVSKKAINNLNIGG